ncbi:hypothetical protein JCM24511_00331 [Saitozyma sp. JCM 24511]|nr:hypothetical protein JCM24511_00331 [Saitozyma sp. JCM 24511]
MGLLDKIKDKVSSSSSGQAHFAPPSAPPSSADIPRYRKQRGVNLGAWFVQEPFFNSDVFRNAEQPKGSDLDIAKGKDAKAILERHWDSWITDEDWKWIKERGFNSVRIPIGYYHLAAPCPEVLNHTDFEPYRDVFSGAWPRIEKAIQTAASHGLGVLVDLHGAAGGQNTQGHSGTSAGQAKLWSKDAHLKSTSAALRFLASHLHSNLSVVGLQLINEPEDNRALEGWYKSILSELRSIVPAEFPLYVGDAWNADKFASWVGSRGDFVVLDTHVYRAFTDGDKRMTGEQHAHKLRTQDTNDFGRQSEAAKGSLVVCEWSGALDHGIYGNAPDTEKDRQSRMFVAAELEVFEKHMAGWWWWTYKSVNWMAGWSARNASQAEILPAKLSRSYKGPPPQGKKDQALNQAHESHKSYWASHGGSPNPAVFAPGFSKGWDDALMFLTAPGGPHEMGFIHQWASRRMVEYEAGQGQLGKAAWEWEHGFAQGVKECGDACLAW